MFYEKSQEKVLDAELFKNPTKEYRGAPFWAWNCAMNKEMLEEQIGYLKEMGFGGFHMHSRSGMTIPYLGEEFMDLVKFCVGKAKEEDMYAYLYDEDRWASGFAGGYVTKNPHYRLKELVFSTKQEEHFPEEIAFHEGKTYLMAVYDIQLNEQGELIEYQCIDEQAPSKGRKWYAYLKCEKETPWYNNYTYVDTLSKDAIDEFIRITHPAFEQAVGSEFGKTCPSIFSDEPQFTHKQPLGYAHSAEDAVFPWTYSVKNSFREKYGYDILDKLPEIIWNLPDGKLSAARYHYHDHITDKFVESYADNIGKWCEEHGLLFTGHLKAEHKLEFQNWYVGEAMRSYRSFGIPGMDMLCDLMQFTTAKQVQSVVHQDGREAMLSELYGVTNWDFDFRGHKYQGDWQAALGVTIRVPHLSWVSMSGESKRDYPASINYQSPWHKEYKYIEDHYARVNTALTRGKPVVKAAVIHPIESFWLYFGPEENTKAKRDSLDQQFQDMIDWLVLGTIDFDFISEALLQNQFRGTEGGFRVGEMTYEAVVVPDCVTLRRTTVEALRSFVSAGGKVIFAGQCPSYIDAIEDSGVCGLYEESVKIPFQKMALLESLKDYRIVEIKNSNGVPTDNLLYNMRQDNDCKWLFIAHGKKTDSDPMFRENTEPQDIKLYIKGNYKPVLYDTLSGEICEIPFTYEKDKTAIPYKLYQSNSILLRLDETVVSAEEGYKTEDTIEFIAEQPTETIRFFGKVDYTREEPNVLLLDRADYALDDEPFHEEEEILILDNLCRTRMGWPLRADQNTQPWVVKEEPIQNSITLRFKIHSEIEVEGANLAIEDARTLEIWFNGESISNEPNGWYVDKTIDTVALPAIHEGINELVVKVPFGKRTNTEWCYILGEFNVKVEGTIATIISKTEQIGFSTLINQGMPFYGGNIIYKMEIDTPSCDLVIRATYYRGALIKVFVDGEEMGNIVFAPYRLKVHNLSAGSHRIELKLYGNRVNTFGGVHNIMQPSWVGPDFWRTTGDKWCYEYSLKDTGILASPVIEVYKK